MPRPPDDDGQQGEEQPGAGADLEDLDPSSCGAKVVP
jgi:hypothetical protein